MAARIGQAVAFGLGFLGLFGNPLLIIVALFVFLAAGQEAYAVELGEATKEASTKHATITSFRSLDTQSTVGEAVKLLLSASQREFPVTDGSGRLRGVLTRDGMIKALGESRPDRPVLDVRLRYVPVVNCHAPLSEAVSALQTTGQPLIGVVDDEQKVVGIVTLENLAEYMMVAQTNQDRPTQRQS